MEPASTGVRCARTTAAFGSNIHLAGLVMAGTPHDIGLRVALDPAASMTVALYPDRFEPELTCDFMCSKSPTHTSASLHSPLSETNSTAPRWFKSTASSISGDTFAQTNGNTSQRRFSHDSGGVYSSGSRVLRALP